MKEKRALSARMQAVADMVTKGCRVCDVGCDHGYVSIYLVRSGISPFVLAMDINEGPLGRAGEHIFQAGLEEYITLRLSDGLSAYEPGEADCLVCAGMGGRLMRRILAREPLKTQDFQELILQPQSEVAAFRKFLRDEGYLIVRENMVYGDGKFYPVIKAVGSFHAGEGAEEKSGAGAEMPKEKRRASEMDVEKKAGAEADGKWELEDRFGPLLLREKHPVLFQYIKKEWENNCKIRSALMSSEGGERVILREKELAREMAYLKAAAGIFGLDLR